MKILRHLLFLSLAPWLATAAQALTVEYDYDGAYNRTAEFTRAANGTLIKHLTYHYDDAGRLTRIENVTDPAQTETFGYDANGNQISRSVGMQQTAYTFDARDQLLTVEKGDGTTPPALLARYRYNADGLRVDGEEQGQARRFSWDDDQLILTREPDATLSRFQWGPNRLANLVSTKAGVTRRDWYFFDALGSVTALVSDAGELSATFRFDAFGKIRMQTGETNSRFAFTGHQYDAVSELYYFKARYYDPLQGRFVSEDSFEGMLPSPESRNGYLYANANPLVFVDEDGHFAGTLFGGAMGAAWGTGQAIGGFGYDVYNNVRYGEKMRGAGEYLSVVAQNTIGGAQIGAAVDVSVASGGTAAFVGGGALGSAGAGALTVGGKAESWGGFAKQQGKDAATGAVFGGAAKVAAPALNAVAGKVAERLPVVQKMASAAGKGAEAAAARLARTGVAGDVRALAAQAEAKVAKITERAVSATKAPPAAPPKARVEMAESTSGPGAKVVAKAEVPNNAIPEGLYADTRGVYGYLPKEGSRYYDPLYDFTDPAFVARQRAIRLDYLKGSDELEAAISSMRQLGKNSEEIASRVVLQRNSQKIWARELMSPGEVARLEAGNMKLYGDSVGPTPRQMFDKYGDWDIVVKKSMQKDPVINKLLGIDK